MKMRLGTLSQNRKTQLQSLIDMAFILLIFFLVTSLLAKMGGSEQKLAIPTPKNQEGQAQIVIQIIDADRYMFLGAQARLMAETVVALPLLESMIITEIVGKLPNYIISRSALKHQISELKAAASADPKYKYFVLIRCPDEVPYSRVMDIIEGLSGVANLQYGCVGGVVEEILHARRIYEQRVIEDGVPRKNIVFEF